MYDDSSENLPGISMMQGMYTTTFGNGNFVIKPPSKGEVGQGFPTVPYLSIEAILYQQQASNPMASPVFLRSGSNTGQQVISGQYTMQDSTQTNRYQMGYQSGQ